MAAYAVNEDAEEEAKEDPPYPSEIATEAENEGAKVISEERNFSDYIDEE